MTYRVKKSKCPACSHVLDAATGLEDVTHVPEPGDVTLCINCLELLEFDEKLGLSILDFDRLDDEDKTKVTAWKNRIHEIEVHRKKMQEFRNEH